ncbi:HTH domain-containing protein [Natronococcus wangiae]|uniref:HTH domain-containing protein n=1 Tax=Natronococcus wangiae TaxID=3068275 RepID=UPI00273EF309|nr:HTH domain-containing protein [Natronococcus sp. AD5]
MPVSKSADTEIQAPVVNTDIEGELRVDCYVRSAMPAPLAETVNTVVERLRHLGDQRSC